ncbi:BglG family transcription antiterminator [Cohnella kolymensis]|uniref:BglG family transcription antiterminator n=1 Tax=Cohnella kolymensis TaxID=1590652 RepID=UPI001F27E9C4|nr:BglG family transcription antiterminator [Cohnella kolymensis]
MSNRQRRLLEVLLNRQDEITAGQIAEEIHTSTRTVHRELQELEPLLSSYGLSLVKKSGIGIMIGGSKADLAGFKQSLNESETVTYSPEERKVLLICRLLEEDAPVKLFALAHYLHAAIPTVSHDFDEIEPQLYHSGLALIRRRGYGVEIEGPESSKRRFIARLAQEFLDHSDLFGATHGQSSKWPVTRKLLTMVGVDNFFAIEKTLWDWEDEWPNRLSETAYTHLLIQLSVAISRMQRGHWILSSEQPAAADKEQDDPRLNRLAAPFGLELPEGEKAYLLKLLDGGEEKASDASGVLLEKYGLMLAETAVDLIRSVDEHMDIPFTKDRSLLDGLIRHMGPALERLRRGEVIRNPLLPQIKKDYESLFAAVRAGVDQTVRDAVVPDEEIGYIVMHFGASVERLNLFPRSIKALLVCTSGIGSSKLLAVRINKEIPQIDLIGHYSWYEAARIPEERYDLIISTVDLQLAPDRYIKLSPLLTREETERLKSYIRKITLKKVPAAEPAAPADHGPWDRIKLMHGYALAAIQLLDRFAVYRLDIEPGERHLENVVTEMVGIVSSTGNIVEEDTVIRQLINREKQGSQIIPDTQLALFHTRSESVRQPVLCLFRLNVPLLLGEEQAAADVSHILLMLAPGEIDKPSLEVLSEVSAMLLQPEMVELLKAAETERIKAFISRELEAFIKSKLEWREHS